MSKKFKGKTCVYCGTATSETADHVFALEFFLPSQRTNLPKVPACVACNNAKSKIEHYLATVMPFAGRHGDANQNLSQMVPGRLAKNARLHRSLQDGMGQAWSQENGIIVPAMTLPLDSDRVGELFAYITKGLLWHHWKVILDPAKTGVWSGYLNSDGVAVHRSLLALNSPARVNVNLGNGTFAYEGAQGTDIPEMSVWLFTPYGGMQLSGDPDRPEEVTTTIGAVTATKAGLERFMTLVTSPPQPVQPKPVILTK